ncbi:hypothetical protein B484DRAFT_39744 [Ochromonadaceae sp. CCMP2298]|nr:hypothetical protein B484DRAFT_39744 [Ochromonadaceae sp. CCMP2298]
MAGAPPASARLVFLLWVILCVLANSGDTNVLYFSYMGANETDDMSTVTQPPVLYPQLLSTDDSPYSRVDLPFPFALLGRLVNTLFVSPNGGLHLSINQPCAPNNNFATGPDLTQCNFNTAYYSSFGWFTDLNPSASPQANITSYFGDNFLTLRFTQIRFFDSSNSCSFRITVFRDHHISIAYDHLPPLLGNEAYLSPPYYSTGLRSGDPLGDADFASFNAAQKAIGNNVWSGGVGGTVEGVYPSSLQEVRSGRQFNICPASGAWCLQPAVLGMNQTESESLGTLGAGGNVSLSALMLGCVGGVQFGVLLTPSWEVDSVAVSGNTSALVCGAIDAGAGAGADTGVRLGCDAAALRALLSPYLSPSYAQNTISVRIWPAWRLLNWDTLEPNSLLGFEAIETSLYLNLMAVASLEMYANSSGEEALSGQCSSTDSDDSGDSGCAVCAGNYTSFAPPCRANSSSSTSTVTSDLFIRLDCNSSCPSTYSESTYISTYSAQSTYYTGIEGCCALSQQDCMGTCQGSAIPALNKYGSTICCSTIPDCTGLCGGLASPDLCGVCGGSDTTGATCFNSTGFTVTTPWTTPALQPALYPQFDLGNSSLLVSMPITLSNRTPFLLRVHVVEEGSLAFTAPELNFSTADMLLQPNTSHILQVRASIKTLFKGITTEWEVKKLGVVYRREVDEEQVSVSLSVPVYSSSGNCSVVQDRDRCVRLPGCVYCFESKMRILRGWDRSRSRGRDKSRNRNRGWDKDMNRVDNSSPTSFLTFYTQPTQYWDRGSA